MPLYNQKQVDATIKTRVLSLLTQNDSDFVICYVLDTVFLDLLIKSYPLEETYRWVSASEKTPADLYEKQSDYYDNRRLCYWFWNEFCKHDYGSAQQRSPNGSRAGNLLENILPELTTLPFLSAVHTWFAICEVYLQICNIDWYLEKYRHSPQQLQLWKPGEENEIPKYLAGMMAIIYR